MFTSPTYLVVCFLSLRTALPFLLHLYFLHILTSFLNTHGSFFDTVVLVHLNNIIEEIIYASVCMLYDGSDMKVLMLLQHCIWWFYSSGIWSSISGFSDPDVMWQHGATILRVLCPKRTGPMKMMTLCDLPMLHSDNLVKQYPIPEEWSPQVTCNLKSESVLYQMFHEISFQTRYKKLQFCIIWFCHLIGIHGAVILNLYLTYVFMLKLYSILWWWILIWIFDHNSTMCLVLYSLI
jgi:hypothetical protein